MFQNAFEAALITWLAGIRRRYGYVTDGRSFLLTDPVARPDPAALVHQVHYYWDLLKPLGVTGSPSVPALAVSENEIRAMDERFGEFVTTSISSGPPPQKVIDAYNRGDSTDVFFADGSHRGYLHLTVTPTRLEADLVGYDSVREKQAVARSLARFTLEDGQRGLRKG